MTRHMSTAVTRVHATCRACPWETTGLNGLGNAAKHHDATGHPVTVLIERRVDYGDAASYRDPAQTSLLEETAPA